MTKQQQDIVTVGSPGEGAGMLIYKVNNSRSTSDNAMVGKFAKVDEILVPGGTLDTRIIGGNESRCQYGIKGHWNLEHCAHFCGKVEEEVEDTIMVAYELDWNQSHRHGDGFYDKPIVEALGGAALAETKLTHICHLLRQQVVRKHEDLGGGYTSESLVKKEGILQTKPNFFGVHSDSNLFYVRSMKGGLVPVKCFLDGSLGCWAIHVDYFMSRGYEYPSGTRIFAPKPKNS